MPQGQAQPKPTAQQRIAALGKSSLGLVTAHQLASDGINRKTYNRLIGKDRVLRVEVNGQRVPYVIDANTVEHPQKTLLAQQLAMNELVKARFPGSQYGAVLGYSSALALLGVVDVVRSTDETFVVAQSPPSRPEGPEVPGTLSVEAVLRPSEIVTNDVGLACTSLERTLDDMIAGSKTSSPMRNQLGQAVQALLQRPDLMSTATLLKHLEPLSSVYRLSDSALLLAVARIEPPMTTAPILSLRQAL